jgi:hypothetical protein
MTGPACLEPKLRLFNNRGYSESSATAVFLFPRVPNKEAYRQNARLQGLEGKGKACMGATLVGNRENPSPRRRSLARSKRGAVYRSATGGGILNYEAHDRDYKRILGRGAFHPVELFSVNRSTAGTLVMLQGVNEVVNGGPTSV